MILFLMAALATQTTPDNPAAPAIPIESVEGRELIAVEYEMHPVTQAVKRALETDGGPTDKPFTLIVRIDTDAPKEVIAAFRKATPKTRKEEGNKAYQLHRSADEPDTFLLYERWRSLDDLDRHLKSDYIAELLAVLEAKASIELKVMRPVAGGKPKGKS